VNRNELVDAVAGKADLSKSAANKAVDAVFESLTDALKRGGEVRLVGFGTFSVASRAASEGRNSRTGQRLKAFHSRRKFGVLRRKPMGEMTPLRAAIILHVWRHQDDPASRLAPAVRADPEQVLRVVNELTAEGILTWRTDPHDKRVRSLSLAADAGPLVDQILGVGYAVREYQHGTTATEIPLFSEEKKTILRDQWAPQFSAQLLEAFRKSVETELSEHISAGHAPPSTADDDRLILARIDNE
jgi:DNA-binding protein HU-beta